ncbi:MAG: CopD family protein, partial [Thiotrichales bacterium]|nr:CopD family protein [Thiotrichales bacterium]
MLWIKAFHVIFVVAWYAGLLYLPRLFVYHAQTDDTAGDERFKVMERKLFAIMTVGGLGALVFGLWLVADYAWAAFAASGWFRVKLVLVAALVLY